MHKNRLKIQIEMFGGVPRELQKLSDTRQASRYFVCKNIVDRLAAVILVLDEISNEDNPDRAVDSRGLLPQIDIKFIGLLPVF